MKTKIITLFFIALTKLTFGQYQQYIQYVSPYLSDSIQSGFFYFNTPNNFQAGQLYQLYRQNAPDLNNNMVLIDKHVDSLAGLTHLKYQQTYMNIPIEGAGCIEHYDKYGSLQFINAKIADSIKKDQRPRLNGDEAVNTLIEYLKKDEKLIFAWNDQDWEQQIRLDYADSNATWYPNSELIWAIDTVKNIQLINSGNRYNLAYKISITVVQPEFETFIYYVDANTGMVLKFNSTHINDGPAGVYGYGSKIIDTQWKGGFTQKYILQTNDATRVVHTKKNPSGSTAWGLLDNTKDDNDNWGNTYLTETSTHYHVSTCWDYYRNVFGRTGQNNASREVRVRTQWNTYNAQFIPGGSDHNDLRFGKDNNGWDFGLEASIVAHEFAHGVTHHSSNLTYSYESGALNEAFSDIFGVVIQAVMLDGGSSDWIIGNFIPNMPLRSLKEPNLYNQPDTYLGLNWYTGAGDIGGVHVNSGVLNKWFYVLAHGDNGTNDLSNYYDVDGIGINKASRIAYYAQTSLLLSSSQYSDARQATIQAAKILYGECSVEHQATIDSWYAVGIGNLNNCTYTASVEDISNQNILIYPNPANNSISIELPMSTESPIRIIDLSGNLIKEFETNQVFFQTDISNISSGVYLIKFDFQGSQVVKRIIVQK
jgi:Zn-dependent metalloprotease